MTANAETTIPDDANAEAPTSKLRLVWNQTTERVQSAFHNVEKDARELAHKVEAMGRERFEVIRGQLKVEELFGRVKGAQGLETIEAIGTEAAEKLGVATTAALATLTERLEKVEKKVSRRRPAAATKKDLTALTERVTALETALAELQGKANAA